MLLSAARRTVVSVLSCVLATAASARAQVIQGTIERGDAEVVESRLGDTYPVQVTPGTPLQVRIAPVAPLLLTVLFESSAGEMLPAALDSELEGESVVFTYTLTPPRAEMVKAIVVSIAPFREAAGTGRYAVSFSGGRVAAGGGEAPPRPSPSGRGVEMPPAVIRQLAAVAERVGEQGYHHAGLRPLSGALNGGTQEDQPLPLQRGREYLIVGVCDGDCSDMDLRLFAPEGAALAEDVANDDLPILRVTPRAGGEHRLRVMMPACSADPCFYGVSVFAK